MTDREDGATGVVVAVMLTCLLAAAGIGIDTTSMAFQRSRVQHGTDAAALAVAQSCKAGACNSGLAGQYVSENATGGGSNSGPSVSITSNSVTVGSTKAVNTTFFGLLGIDTKSVAASSTASWNTSPTSGYVQPYLVSLCEYTNGLPVNKATFLDADATDRLTSNTYKSKAQSVLETEGDLTADCGSIPSGVTGVPSTTRMIKGGLWKSSNDKCNASLSSGKSTLDIGDGNSSFALCASNTQQADKYGEPGDPDDIQPNAVSLFAIYAPTANFRYGGVITNPPNGTASTSKIDGSPSFRFKIVGFAPFKVTGFRLGKSSNPCRGSCPNGKVGIWGAFVNDISKDADYEVGGPNIGSVVKLIN
jgi:Flp pilus assembly protein TadG